MDLFEASIAAAFYFAAYMSLLRLLIYPRNWCAPAPSTLLTTGGLVVALVTFVSVSSQGVDVALMCISAAFVVVLFTIISAPAIDFLPGNDRPAIQFLAGHGAYAGLWMLPVAVAAGYAVPDPKFLGALAAAMVIEVLWYVRHRPTGARRPYILNDQDVSVLKTQAKGNIGRFAKRHGIGELDMSGDDVRWQGCSKDTLPCAFNLYTNRLGLNTAPCCREHLKDICLYVCACLSDMKVAHWLEGGSLLGAVREHGALLAWEDDIDISAVLEDGEDLASLAKELTGRCQRDGYYVDLFVDKSLIAISFDPPQPWPFLWERSRMRGEIRVDLAFYRHAVSQDAAVLERISPKGALPKTESGWYGVPKDVVLPTTRIEFLGKELPCPNRSDDYLRRLYGDYNKVEFTYIDPAAAETRRFLGTDVAMNDADGPSS
jgi:hypothetical protein